VPTNFNPAGIQVIDGGGFGDAGWTNAPDIEVTTTPSCFSRNACPPADGGQSLPPATTITMDDADGTLADLYVLRSLTVDVAASLSIAGPRPVILAVLTSVDVKGSVTVSAGALGSGPGIGQGLGGGSYCGMGGAGTSSAPGSAYGTPTLYPLLGGSNGGGTSSNRGVGGGALQIAAGMSIDVGIQGSINAGGTGGSWDGYSQGGGGSGGALLLEAPTISIRGSIAANGGGGTGQSGTANDQPAGSGSAGTQINGGPAAGSTVAGGGGAGRIRINTANGAATIPGIVSPSLEPGPDGGSPCATEGVLN
jgi:hypothetical protein